MWIFVVESGVWLQISFAQLVTVAKHGGENKHENKGFKVSPWVLGGRFSKFWALPQHWVSLEKVPAVRFERNE